jgi:hypothetical protein
MLFYSHPALVSLLIYHFLPSTIFAGKARVTNVAPLHLQWLELALLEPNGMKHLSSTVKFFLAWK